MDQLRAMEIFVEVARLRSFSAAGRRLGITRAMVSKHVMQLEEKLQVRLLHRSTREVSLTDIGQAYLAPCIATVAQAQEAARAVTHAGADLAGPLRIQAPSSFGSAWLADALARFSLPHPQLTPMLHVDDALLDPIEHGFDLTIRVGGIPDSHALAMRPLAPCRAVRQSGVSGAPRPSAHAGRSAAAPLPAFQPSDRRHAVAFFQGRRAT